MRLTSLRLALAAASLSLLATFSHATEAPIPPAYFPVTAAIPCGTTTCHGELWLPPGVANPPVIVMAHGFGAQMDWGLKPFAQRFVQNGLAVLRFDYRGFGQSGGLPRNVVNAQEQLKDWGSAIDFVRQRSDVDGQRLGLWGTSFSGGHVIKLGALRGEQIKAISAQVPFLNGSQSGALYPAKYLLQASLLASADALRSPSQTPIYIPIFAADSLAALICAECVSGYGRLIPAGQEGENKVAARVFLNTLFYAPGSSAAKVAAPTLVIAAENDGLFPIAATRTMAKGLPKGEYLELSGANHFSPYFEAFEQVVARETAFFKAHL